MANRQVGRKSFRMRTTFGHLPPPTLASPAKKSTKRAKSAMPSAPIPGVVLVSLFRLSAAHDFCARQRGPLAFWRIVDYESSRNFVAMARPKT